MDSPGYHHQYYLDNMKKIKERGRKFYQEHKREFIERAVKRGWYKEHPEARALAVKKSHKKLKEIVLSYYGGGKLACVKCGFDDTRALSIDHINGGGYEHRKILKGNGVHFYQWLKREGYPSGYQTLCMNCQFIKREVDKECLQKDR